MTDGYGPLTFGILNENGFFTGTNGVATQISLTPDDDTSGRPMWAQEFCGSLTVNIEDHVTFDRLFGQTASSPGEVVSLAFERRHVRRLLPRTVRDAKRHRKGQRGKPRRRKVSETTRTVIHDARVARADNDVLSANQSDSGTTITFEATSTNTESMGVLDCVSVAQRAINE